MYAPFPFLNSKPVLTDTPIKGKPGYETQALDGTVYFQRPDGSPRRLSTRRFADRPRMSNASKRRLRKKGPLHG